MESSLFSSLYKKSNPKICIMNINNTYYENIYNINFLNCPTPTRLMGKDKETIKKWRLYMDYKQKNRLLNNDDLYKHILL